MAAKDAKPESKSTDQEETNVNDKRADEKRDDGVAGSGSGEPGGAEIHWAADGQVAVTFHDDPPV